MALDATVELDQLVASVPQETVRTDREAVYDHICTPLARGLAVESWHGSRAFGTAVEGAERFVTGEGRGRAVVEQPDEQKAVPSCSSER